ncbi:MAG TPA: hypothetical protein VMS18_19775 [Candidatus Binatia bacterium]|nr:hypothetical protein [Candidatus Binatia bacterium]
MRFPEVPPTRTDRWKDVYEGAVADSEYSLSLDRIADARNAILDRAEEILTLSSTEERRALNQALRTLRLLEESANRNGKAA